MKLIRKIDRGPAPGSSRTPAEPPRAETEPVIVHKPRCRDEAYLTVQGGLNWDHEHLAQWEADL